LRAYGIPNDERRLAQGEALRCVGPERTETAELRSAPAPCCRCNPIHHNWVLNTRLTIWHAAEIPQ
jgi:hypothetical protein